MKYFIEINEVGGRFEVVYFQGEERKADFSTMEDAMSFAADCDFSKVY